MREPEATMYDVQFGNRLMMKISLKQKGPNFHGPQVPSEDQAPGG